MRLNGAKSFIAFRVPAVTLFSFYIFNYSREVRVLNTEFFEWCSTGVGTSQTIPLGFSDIFPKRLGIFSSNFTHFFRNFFRIHIYARLQNFIRLSLTKLCHIKCNHPPCVSADGGHFEHVDWVVALNMA